MSSGSESDDEYVPGEPEVVSEEDSANEETDLQYEKELEKKATKRKAKEDTKIKKKTRNRKYVQETFIETHEESKEVPEKVDPVEEKKREDDLWALFLEGTDSKSTKTNSKETNGNNTHDNKCTEKADNSKKVNEKQKSDADAKARETRIFEFAGETLVVEDNIIKERIKSDTLDAATTLGVPSTKSRSSGGLSSVLDHLNKKSKLSTLEKSKLDWETLKKEENIEDEIKNYNKGKDGYLDRQDFLERADVRQFEIERNLRMSRRSKRL